MGKEKGDTEIGSYSQTVNGLTSTNNDDFIQRTDNLL